MASTVHNEQIQKNFKADRPITTNTGGSGMTHKSTPLSNSKSVESHEPDQESGSSLSGWSDDSSPHDDLHHAVEDFYNVGEEDPMLIEGNDGEDIESDDDDNSADQKEENYGDEGKRQHDDSSIPKNHRRKCGSCGIDISAMHYLKQIQHVKQCISKRGIISSNNNDKTQQLITEQRPPPPPPPPRMDIKQWLKDLEMENYIDKFISEEIDMTIVHALDEADLRSLGIDDLLMRRRFMSAARKVGEELAAIKCSEKLRTRNNSIINNNRKVQQTLKPQNHGDLGATTLPPTALKSTEFLNSTTGNNSTVTKDFEHRLLSSLYPTSTASASPQPTPPLPPPRALTTARVQPDSSLFVSASRCERVTESLEHRFEKRKHNGGSGGECAPGSLRFSTHTEEGRAIKMMKLQALKEELRTHESTVAELRRLIQQIEAEIQ